MRGIALDLGAQPTDVHVGDPVVAEEAAFPHRSSSARPLSTWSGVFASSHSSRLQVVVIPAYGRVSLRQHERLARMGFEHDVSRVVGLPVGSRPPSQRPQPGGDFLDLERLLT